MIMDGKLVLSLAVIVLAASPVQPFPGGAPSQACSDLRPSHGVGPQTTTSPYELVVDMFEDISVPPAVPTTYSYTPSQTYDRKHSQRLSDCYNLCVLYSYASSESRGTCIRSHFSVQRVLYSGQAGF